VLVALVILGVLLAVGCGALLLGRKDDEPG
jgi:hypothetical protein